MPDKMDYTPTSPEEEEKFAKEMIEDINGFYNNEIVRYFKREYNKECEQTIHTIEINVVTAIVNYEGDFRALVALFNGLQLGRAIIDNLVAESMRMTMDIIKQESDDPVIKKRKDNYNLN